MNRTPRPLPLVVMVSGLALWHIAPGFAGDDEPDPRLDEMRRRATELRVRIGKGDERRPLAVAATPLLRFNDPARDTTDGSIWAIGTSGRPRALLSLFLEPDEDGRGRWSYEFVGLGGASEVEVASRGDWSWTPESDPFAMQPLPDSGRPADSKGARMTQMKILTRRFAVTEKFLGEEYRLRLAPQPVLRYADADQQLVDGAVFVFSYGTNPELALVLECRGKPGAERWEYGFARLSAAECRARLGEKVVWSGERVDKSLPADPYFIQFVQDDVEAPR